MKKSILTLCFIVPCLQLTAQDGIENVLRMNAIMYNGADRVMQLYDGDTVLVFPEIEGDRILCEKGGKKGFVSHIALTPDNDLLQFHDWPENISSYFKTIIKDREWRASFREKLDASISGQKEARLKEMVEKYGKSNGKRIADEEIWIGMKREMLIDSRGYPDDINRTVVPGNTHEQFVYGSQYIYVENGVVTAWQD